MAAVADHWQLEAVHHQFDVFNSFTSMYRRFTLDGSASEVIHYVSDIVRRHSLLNGGEMSSVKEISSEIIRNVPKHEKEAKCSFIVIIMNKEVDDKLMKVPVFIVMADNRRLFIDVTCSVYKTWQAFMCNNNLPACEFCFPVDGFYNIFGKLIIDFGVSRGTVRTVARAPVSGGVMLSVSKLATSFICTMPQTVFRCVRQLFSVAKQFLPRFSEGVPLIPYIQQTFDNLRFGSLQITHFFHKIFTVFDVIFSGIKQTTSNAWSTVCRKLYAISNYISKTLGKYYELASSASRYMFLAVTSRIDSKIKGIELKAKSLLSSKNATELSSAISLKTSVDSELDATTLEFDTVEKYFKNSKLESSFFYGGKGKNIDSCFDADSLSPSNLNLLTISRKIADRLQYKNLDEVLDIYESLGDSVVDEYDWRMKNYSQSLEAARASAGGNMDVKAFNNALGIKGEPEVHFWNEICTNMSKDDHLISNIMKTLKGVQMKKDIFMMPLWKKCEEGGEGLYKVIGIQGAGKFSAQKLVTFLKDKGNISLDVKGALINETDSLICIRFDKFTILVQQAVDEENTAEGMVYIREHDV